MIINGVYSSLSPVSQFIFGAKKLLRLKGTKMLPSPAGGIVSVPAI